MIIHQLLSYSRIYPCFLELECSSPCSEEPATGAYCARWIQSITSHHIALRYILILFSCLYLGLSSSLFPSGFPIETLYAFLFYPMCATCHVHLILRDLIILTMFGEEYVMKFLKLYYSLYIEHSTFLTKFNFLKFLLSQISVCRTTCDSGLKFMYLNSSKMFRH